MRQCGGHVSPSAHRTDLRCARAQKAAYDRFVWLVTHANVSGREAGQDRAVRAYRAKAGRLWHNLPAGMRAAMRNPDREAELETAIADLERFIP